MHGLINRSLQCFLRDTYGAALWARVAHEARLGFDSFEPMLTYEPGLTLAVLTEAARILGKPQEVLLEDLGTYLVSHPSTEAVRRLLRFGGVSFFDFLHSLEDLPERGRLAVPDLDLPALDLADLGNGEYRLMVSSPMAGAGHVLMGLLRAMADDYGALVLLDQGGAPGAAEDIHVHLLDHSHSSGRRFDLSGWATP